MEPPAIRRHATMTRRGSPSRLTSLDLFAGAGGFALGLEGAGFDCIGLVENDAVAAETLVRNFGKRPLTLLGPERGDVREIGTRTLRAGLRRAEVSDLDLLVAGPPCQGFSRVGRGKLDSINAGRRGSFARDNRNGLYAEAVRVLHALRPRLFVFENVSGILHLRGRNVAEDVCDAIAEAGYVVRCTLLNAAWYGVPQNRERVIIIAAREDLDVEPVFPPRWLHAELTRGHLSGAELDRRNWRKPEYFVDPRQIPAESGMGRAVTVAAALEDLPPFTGHLEARDSGARYRPRRESMPAVPYAHDPRNWYCRMMREWSDELTSEVVTDHYCRWTPRDFETFARMNPGDRYPDAIAIARQRYHEARQASRRTRSRRPRPADFIPPYPVDSFPDKWRKLVPDAPSWTVTAHLSKDTYSHIHFDSRQARSITIREAARLQSFPDAFDFAGNMGDAFRQIGNAVPPLLAREIGVALRALLARVDGRADRERAAWSREWERILAHPA